ncbi:MAG: DUF4274 domain-containing protein [Mycobacterium sp.]
MPAEDPAELHRRAQAYNWDSGVAGARHIALHPDCDRATALLMYWRSSPHYYRRYATVEQAPARAREATALLGEIEKRLLSDDFRAHTVFFDPVDDEGIDRTRATDDEESLAVRPIPGELYRACGPRRQASSSVSVAQRLEQGCRSGDTDAVTAALADGVWDQLEVGDQRALLVTAVELDHIAVTDALLAKGISPRFTHGHRTLLDDAISVAMIDLLIAHGADPTKATLALSVAKGPPVVRRLVEVGVSIDGLSRWGEPAIYRAAVDGHVEVVWALIELGANRDVPRESDGRTAVQAVDERLAVVGSFLEHDAPYDCPERTEYGRLTSARIALTGDRKTEDARYW